MSRIWTACRLRSRATSSSKIGRCTRAGKSPGITRLNSSDSNKNARRESLRTSMTSCLAALFNERFNILGCPTPVGQFRRDFVSGSAADKLGVNPGPDLAILFTILDDLIERRIFGRGGG